MLVMARLLAICTLALAIAVRCTAGTEPTPSPTAVGVPNAVPAATQAPSPTIAVAPTPMATPTAQLTPTVTPAPQPTSTPERPPSPEPFVLTSFRGTAAITLRGTDRVTEIRYELTVDAKKRLQIVSVVDGKAFRMIIAPPYVYVHVERGGWSRIDADEFTRETGVSLDQLGVDYWKSLIPDSAAISKQLAEINFQIAGTEVIDGTETRRFRFDDDGLLEVAGTEYRRQLVRWAAMMHGGSASSGSPSGTVHLERLDLWIDDQMMLHRSELDLIVQISPSASTRMSATYFDFNRVPDIALPTHYQEGIPR